ncbi:MAG TPA: DUF3352 domain-containing protein [Solirubrobacteraceae bacterium]|nr:DUF3352 domain-containing protein [Solirubrobacteraceae bacterium]
MRGSRRLFILIGGLVLACVLAACGSSSGSGSSSDPLATELSYIPPGSPVAATIVTDPNSAPVKNVTALLTKFQVLSLLTSSLKQQLQKQGLTYDADIKPLLGNPVVVGTVQTAGAGSKLKGVGVWVTKDAGKLHALATKSSNGDRKIGSHDGATLYRSKDGQTVLAVDGPTLVVADTRALVTAALDRHANNSGMTVSQYQQETAGLPSHPLIQVFGNVASLLATPQTATARRIPWVAAIKGYAVAISPTSNGMSLDWKVDTTGRKLTAAQLPLAAGSAAPALPSGEPGSFGIRDPAQIATFALSAVQAADPNAAAQFQAALGALHNGFGIDVTGALGQLTGDLITAGEGPVSLIRAGVGNPAVVSQTLANLSKHIQSLAPGTSMRPVGGGFYLVSRPSLTFAVGLVGNQLVAGNASISKLRAFATKPTTPSGGQGAIAFSESLPQVLKLTGGLVHSTQAQLILSQLKAFSGWIANTPSALTGNALVTIK